MPAHKEWLEAMWPFVRSELPAVASRVIEIGCGPLGGFVPALLRDGHEAVGIDPEAPEAPGYERIEFERYRPPQPVDAIVACTSLHHVGDLDEVVDRAVESLVPGGALVVVEWAWERFDEATAKWCFSRLGPAAGTEHGWLHMHRDAWSASGQSWDAYFHGWAKDEGLHTGHNILRGLAARFEDPKSTVGPYFFPDLIDTSEADEQSAIDADKIRATGIRYSARSTQPDLRVAGDPDPSS